jgi:phosphatidylinositol alpha-mannosyltransferase
LWVGQRLKRVTFNKYGIPNGSSDGYINTVMGALEGKIAVSNATADFWKGIYPSEYEVIHNGINTDELIPDGPKIEAWQDGKKTILFAGRHDERKGIEYLLEAYRLLSTTRRNGIKLKITGVGKMTERLMQMTKEMNLIDIEFVGVLSRAELIKAYRTADIFVSPATGGEGFGRTLAEAMACGTLTIGSDIDGYREVLDYQPFAGMVKPKDPYDLAKQIAQFLDLPEETRQKFESDGANYAKQRFSWDIIAQKHILYYEKKLSEHGRPRQNDWPRKKKDLISD